MNLVSLWKFNFVKEYRIERIFDLKKRFTKDLNYSSNHLSKYKSVLILAKGKQVFTPLTLKITILIKSVLQ